ncbi:hypothetical protein [Pseudovibrio sp. POLY-S9]|uniref:hypothetical protein n=1 Tax=Pseudovibrio sp. POLY-S9 TaxID=1576596 RepID=UPI000AF4B60B|nr:hypothetical protein [Pseudovibrio sp. POLY-S9]
MATCNLCSTICKLQQSHAIPNAYFKPMFRTSSGQALSVTEGSSALFNTQNSGKEEMLCVGCEGFLNSTYETPAFNAFKKYWKAYQSGIKCPALDIDSTVLFNFILSVIWRCSISKNDFYSNFDMQREKLEWMKDSFYLKKCPFEKFTAKVERLEDGRDSRSTLAYRKMCLAPTYEAVTIGKKRYVLVSLLFNGFVFSVIPTRLSTSARSKYNALQKGKSKYLMPSRAVHEFEPAMNAIRSRFQFELEQSN